jgi:protoheme ferro-lyase
MPKGPETQISISLPKSKRQNKDDIYPQPCSEKNKRIYKKLPEDKRDIEQPF